MCIRDRSSTYTQHFSGGIYKFTCPSVTGFSLSIFDLITLEPIFAVISLKFPKSSTLFTLALKVFSPSFSAILMNSDLTPNLTFLSLSFERLEFVFIFMLSTLTSKSVRTSDQTNSLLVIQ